MGGEMLTCFRAPASNPECQYHNRIFKIRALTKTDRPMAGIASRMVLQILVYRKTACAVSKERSTCTLFGVRNPLNPESWT